MYWGSGSDCRLSDEYRLIVTVNILLFFNEFFERLIEPELDLLLDLTEFCSTRSIISQKLRL
jgi:hypothetical protein